MFNFVLYTCIHEWRHQWYEGRDSLFVITRYVDWLQGLVQDLSQILGLLSRNYYEYRNASKSLEITLQCRAKTNFAQLLTTYDWKLMENISEEKCFEVFDFNFPLRRFFFKLNFKNKSFLLLQMWFNEQIGTQFKFSSSFKKYSKRILCNPPSHY